MKKGIFKLLIIFSILLFCTSISFATSDTIENTNIQSNTAEEISISQQEMEFEEESTYAKDNFNGTLNNKNMVGFENEASEINPSSGKGSAVTNFFFNYVDIYQTEQFNVVLANGITTLSNKQVGFIINGVTYYRTTDTNGIASITINLDARSVGYYVTYFFNGDSVYASSTQSHNIYVYQKTTKLIPLTQYVHQGDGFKVKLTDGTGVPVANKNVKITVNGVQYTRVTDNYGMANLNINLNPGSYGVSVSFDSQPGYKSLSAISKTLNVYAVPNNAINTLITPLMLTIQSSNGVFQAKLTSSSGTSLVGYTVNFIINNGQYTYSRVTSTNGIATLDISLPSDTYNVVMTFAGYSQYKSTASYQLLHVANNLAYANMNDVYQNYDSASNQFCDYSSSYVMGLASTLTATCTNDLEKFIAIFDYTSRIKSGQYNHGMQTAYNTLVFSLGESAEHSNAFVALCRASGLPVKYVLNPVGSATKYVWVQASVQWLWITVDPTSSSKFGTWGSHQYYSNYRTNLLVDNNIVYA